MRLFIVSLVFILLGTNVKAEDKRMMAPDATSFKTELSGSMATGTNTPFWITSNRYGVVPLDANNGFLQAGVFHNQSFGKGFRWNAGVDIVTAIPRNHNFFIQQLYAEIGYKSLLLSIGSKERYTSLWDQNLSSGDLVFSTNARPIPEINISIPQFTIVPLTKGWMQIKGDFAVGRSFDKDYLADFSKDTLPYINNVLWHHKSFAIQIKDTKSGFPLSGIIGVQHWAQWGGTSTNPTIGRQPHSFKDFIRVVCGSEGSSDATISDQINVLGNHYGSYDFKLTYSHSKWELAAYHQHFFEDKSGMIFKNKTDGLWGMQLDLPQFSWIQKVVVEYLITKNQSGPFHFIEFDHEAHPGHGGGRDDYYNNEEYITGVSYFNRSLGSPFLLSPEYNENRHLGFRGNRVQNWHLGLEGALSSHINYRALISIMNGWGRPTAPFLHKRSGTSSMIDITYRHPQLTGWEFAGTIALDTGSVLGDNFGCCLKITKRGILKNWR